MIHDLFYRLSVINTHIIQTRELMTYADSRLTAFSYHPDELLKHLIICYIIGIYDDTIICCKIRKVEDIVLPLIVLSITTPVTKAVELEQDHVQILFTYFSHYAFCPGINYKLAPSIC